MKKSGRPAKGKAKRKPMGLPLTPAEHKAAKKAAEAAGLPVSVHIRQVYFAHIGFR